MQDFGAEVHEPNYTWYHADNSKDFSHCYKFVKMNVYMTEDRAGLCNNPRRRGFACRPQSLYKLVGIISDLTYESIGSGPGPTST